MRKFAIVVSALALSGCGTVPGSSTGSDVIAEAIKLCSYQPTAATVVNVIAAATNNPAIVGGVVTANSIASAICAAIEAKSAMRLSGPAMVSGVPIRGRFVRGYR
jgi:hypothetical protein